MMLTFIVNYTALFTDFFTSGRMHVANVNMDGTPADEQDWLDAIADVVLVLFKPIVGLRMQTVEATIIVVAMGTSRLVSET